MTHPIVGAAYAVSEELKSVASVNPTFMTPSDKAAALQQLAKAQAQLAELRLRVLAAADDLAAAAAARDAAAWLTFHTRARHDQARADVALARALDQRYGATAEALGEGRVTVEQAGVIVRALDALPTDLPYESLETAEATLIERATQFGPRELARLGRHILTVIAPDIADQALARRLAAEEAQARRATTLSLRRQGDGTTRLSGLLPDAHATRLALYLEAFTNPRKASAAEAEPGSPPQDALARLTYPRRLGTALCQLLEAIDPQRLPIHGGDATTIIITMTLDQLRADIATANLMSDPAIPGADPTDQLTAGQARRLACTANLIPAVLGSRSEVLDLGTTTRLFSKSQRKALQLRDRTCRAEGCTIPATWTEAHHLTPWSHGGPTDLANAVLLCSHHHHQAHHHDHNVHRLTDGTIRFHRRT